MDLSLVSRDNLINELSQRSDAIVVGMYTNRDEQNATCHIEYYGDYLRCCGICDRIKYIVLDDFEESARKSIENE